MYVFFIMEDKMKQLIFLIISFSVIFGVSCKNENNPVTPTTLPLSGEWRGIIEYNFIEYPLSLTLNQVGEDSITGWMVIELSSPDTTKISSILYLKGDSLQFNLSHGGFCMFNNMYGNFIGTDSIAGNWEYHCINELPLTSPWAVHRAK